MTYDRPPTFVASTPGYVLEVLRDQHRQQCQYDSGTDPCVELTFETTVADWRAACDLIDWRGLGRAIDAEWKLGRSDANWREVLEPGKARTLREVCDLIALGAMRPTIEPLTILGKACVPAGTFLAIRSLLRDAGADVTTVSPTTLLDEYARRYLNVFLGPISRLAPNSLPPVRIITPCYDRFTAGFASCLLATLAGWFVTPLVIIPGTILALVLWVGIWIIAGWFPPSKVEFGDLRTFRDLAVRIAEGTGST